MDELFKLPDEVISSCKDRWVKPVGSEQHAADWSSFIAPLAKGWGVVFRDQVLDLCRTREGARIRIREYKANPDLATAAEVLQA